MRLMDIKLMGTRLINMIWYNVNSSERTGGALCCARDSSLARMRTRLGRVLVCANVVYHPEHERIIIYGDFWRDRSPYSIGWVLRFQWDSWRYSNNGGGVYIE